MTVDDVKRIRKALKMTQGEFGNAIGLSLRGYQDIENRNAPNSLRQLHINAIRYYLLCRIAVDPMNSLHLDPETRELARHIAVSISFANNMQEM